MVSGKILRSADLTCCMYEYCLLVMPYLIHRRTERYVDRPPNKKFDDQYWILQWNLESPRRCGNHFWGIPRYDTQPQIILPLKFRWHEGGEIFSDTNLDTVYVGGRKETPQGGDLAEASKKVTSDGVLLIVAYYLLVYFAFIVDVAQAVSMCCHARQNKEVSRILTENR